VGAVRRRLADEEPEEADEEDGAEDVAAGEGIAGSVLGESQVQL
jgi:hypothetical protein